MVDSGGPPPEVWVTGHSLGAGIGTMVAFAAADYLAASMGPDEVGGVVWVGRDSAGVR